MKATAETQVAAAAGDLKVREAADESRVGVNAIYALIRSGELPAYRLSRNATRIPREAWEEFKARGGVATGE